ncbi:shufflon system plasmid conjugative transfer pilus tip adhesin PilV [Dickeya poaceiphila]|uniref:Shufflon system plasmid conjugative transfer pilus tip adhesin PilV n=1 Tax=Dickeya poaceiphila TaxID=568768 RepID=A0A5B8I9Y5_9GAMM|nr:shufflon system plasmid conjugative transfer pilus tip adhesin PilV [Dickeya poaceiphila]QDX30973.1 shufflon system plasmid conjugative transfer pilus tip adhesin PilV [Dickeya poaceiphila]
MNISTRKTPDRGWAIMSTGVSLIILVIVAIWGTTRWNDYLQQREWQVVAAQTSRFTVAVKSYAARYYDTLLNSATTTAPVVITPAMLKSTGFLEAGFSDTNSSGHTYRAAFIRNATNTSQLQALVFTQGGVGLPFLALRQIAIDITNGLGGYIWDGANATGAMNSWSVPLSSFGVSTTNGHIVALLTTDELGAARNENDRLYRFSVTGKPDLNKMHTDIDMGGNNLNNVNAVNAQTGNFSANVAAGGAVTAGENITTTNGWFVSRGNSGWLNETHNGGFYMSDDDWVRSVNDKSIYTGGQVLGGSVRANGRLSAGGVLKLDEINTPGAVCPENGTISRDYSGGVLSCQNGVWKGAASLNNNGCQWIQAPNAFDFIHGYKVAQCPANWVMAGTRWYQIMSAVDDEHVDAYCCPL